MTTDLQYDLCPETGIGCVLVSRDSDSLKLDLMPDEAASLRELIESGDMDGAKALLVSIDAKAERTIDAACLEALAREIR